MFIDLHCHSTASDGTLSPGDVIRMGHENGLTGMSMTDHDTVAGLAEAADTAGALGIDFIPGIEISAEFPHPGTLHILGYGIDPESSILRETTRALIEGRDSRNPKIIEKLQSLGVAITMAEVEAQAAGGGLAEASQDSPPVDRSDASSARQVIGRPHIAAVLLRKGYVSSIRLAFDKYLAPGGLAYFDKERLTPRQALQFIRDAGGVSSLAHAVQLRTANDAELDRAVKDLVDLGLDAIEVFHSDHDAEWVDKTSALASRYHLLRTGGSDFHGRNKESIRLGYVRGRRVPGELFAQLKSAVGKS